LPVASSVPFYAISLLLTATSVAKLWMLLTDSFADVRVGLSKEILWLSFVFELYLAFENLCLRDRHLIAFINSVVFSFFATFASIRWFIGYTSCGRAGSLEIPGWIFVLIDLAIVVWFLLVKSNRNQVIAGWCQVLASWNNWSALKRGRVAGMSLFIGWLVCLQLPFAAPLRTWVLGEGPIKAIVKLDGDLVPGVAQTGQVEFTNRSSQAVKIIGLSRSCRCFDFFEEPFSKIIPASNANIGFGKGRLVLPLAIKPNKPGLLHQRVTIFLDHPNQFQTNVDVFGFVKE
jgi:hypothetical protein